MIIPEYWAEARLREGTRRKPVTVRRFGWSDDSLAAAQAHADARAREAMDRIHAGETLRRIEPKVAYNGAEGVPIREEIVLRDGDSVVSRNGYGALCLNTPDVLFADIDFPTRASRRLWWGLFASLALAGIVGVAAKGSTGWIVVVLVAALVATAGLADPLHRAWQALRGGAEKAALGRVRRFVATHPEWHLRAYRTPAGLRVLAMHRRFAPDAPEVSALFEALGTDPLYVRMCQRQHCFRARVSPKPWRIGIDRHLRPRPGVWPVAADRLPERVAWVAAYEAAARSHASCRFVEAIGSATVDPGAESVRALHDRLARADAGLAIA
ncbi:hypothetical protein [Marilutibacter aestuarii]|uniref:Transmembrane protein n=1 Tax=Marilutibacter aestuarii TaxID=1706195 RepID=A0A508A6X6_9GAMM|nr:hypothetical protein [Lysobacter aestuarii]TQD45147.1 hypothetical protein FKV25_08700 [Lysobacter aestuarii]